MLQKLVRKPVPLGTVVAILAMAGSAFAQQASPPINYPLLPEDMVAEVEPLRRYSVEIIVFEYAGTSAGGSELFEPEPNAAEAAVPVFGDATTRFDNDPGESATDPDFFNAETGDSSAAEESVIEFGDTLMVDPADLDVAEIPSLRSVEYQRLLPEQLTMNGIHERLQDLDAYQPVLWGGWIQAATEREQTPTIHLRAIGTPPIDLDGELTLYLKNYLHLVVDMTMQQQIATIEPVYRQEAAVAGKPTPRYEDDRANNNSANQVDYIPGEYQTILYQIQEDRIFNDGHLRYFDHPKFGVLARISRVDEGALSDETNLDDLEPPASATDLSSGK